MSEAFTASTNAQRRCASCNRTTDVAKFSKTQRRKGQAAKCTTCIESGTTVLPVLAGRNQRPLLEEEAKNEVAVGAAMAREANNQQRCRGCGETKDLATEYSKRQLEKGKSAARCTSCVNSRIATQKAEAKTRKKEALSAKGETDDEKETARKFIRAERRQERRVYDLLQCSTYLTPTVDAQQRISSFLPFVPVHFKKPVVAIAEEEESTESLVGTYDIFYFNACHSPKKEYARTIRGSLVLSAIVKDDGRLLLHGEVEMHPDMRELFPFDFMNDFTFVSIIDEEEESEQTRRDPIGANSYGAPKDCIGFKIVDFPCPDLNHLYSNDDDYGWGTECKGTIRIIGERTATPWSNRDNWEDRDEEERIVFHTLEEAEQINRKAQERFALGKSWICHHFKLPSIIAEMIHEFVAFQPPPALFFEEGDLWLHVDWNPDLYNRLGGSKTSTLVARRRGLEGASETGVLSPLLGKIGDIDEQVPTRKRRRTY